MLMGNNGGTWSNAATTANITVTTSGTYSVTTTNACGSTTSNSIVVTVNSVDTSLTVGNASLMANATNSTYQWLLCNGNYTALSGETNQTFNATMIGAFYAVEVTQNGCVDTSACYPIILTDSPTIADAKEEGSVTYYPNPAHEVLNISINGPFPFEERWRGATITIKNTLGETVYSQNNYNVLKTIDVSGFASGVYFVNLGAKSFKFVKE